MLWQGARFSESPEQGGRWLVLSPAGRCWRPDRCPRCSCLFSPGHGEHGPASFCWESPRSCPGLARTARPLEPLSLVPRSPRGQSPRPPPRWPPGTCSCASAESSPSSQHWPCLCRQLSESVLEVQEAVSCVESSANSLSPEPRRDAGQSYWLMRRRRQRRERWPSPSPSPSPGGHGREASAFSGPLQGAALCPGSGAWGEGDAPGETPASHAGPLTRGDGLPV